MAVDNRLSNALAVLGQGLSTIAQVRGLREERAEERAYQDKVLASQQAFQERLTQLGMQHDRSMMKEGQQFQSSERQASQLFEMEKFNKQMAAEERRHAAEMSARWASIKESAAARSQARSDAKSDARLSRQLKVYELGMTTAANQYQATAEAMQDELATLAKDDMLKLDQNALQAAQQAVRERYSGQLQEARAAIDDNMASYADSVGVGKGKVTIGPMTPAGGASPEPAAAPQSPNTGGGGGQVDREKVAAAVEQARDSLGADFQASPAKLEQAFIAYGLNDQEAKLAARQMVNQSIMNPSGVHNIK